MIPSLFIVLTGYPQEVKISGSLPGASGYKIQITSYDDLISNKKVLLDSDSISKKDSFNLIFESGQIRQISLQTGFYDLSFFAEPGQNYRLSCDSVQLAGEYRPFYYTELLPCSPDAEFELNKKINHFNALYNDFVLEEFGGIYQRRNLRAIEMFESTTDSLFGIPGNDFFGLYREYKVASLILSIAPTKKATLFRKYIDDREIQYQHPEYIHFFKEFFSHRLIYDNRFIRRYEMKNLINQKADYAALIDSIGKDTLLRNERIRELVLLLNLKELYHEPDFNPFNILDYLLLISEESEFPEHRNIAENLYSVLTKLEKGFPAPRFSLPSLQGDTVQLQDLEGKPVYIGFMNTLGFGSLDEFSRMDSLYRHFENRVHFVTVSLDPDKKIIQQFKTEKQYEWLFLCTGMYSNLIDEYDLKTLPVFLLLDQKGNIVQYPARKPSENVSATIENLLNR